MVDYMPLRYTATGGQTTFQIPWDYLLTEYLEVSVDGVGQVFNTDFTLPNKGELEFVTPLTGGEIVFIERNTDDNTPLAVFSDGANLQERSLEKNREQVFNIAEETKTLVASKLGPDFTGNYNAEGNKVTNLANGTDSQDAVTVTQLDGVVAAATAAGAASAATASAAASTASTAATTATNAAAQAAADASAVLAAAAAAEAARIAAEAAETGAEGFRDQAQAIADGISGLIGLTVNDTAINDVGLLPNNQISYLEVGAIGSPDPAQDFTVTVIAFPLTPSRVMYLAQGITDPSLLYQASQVSPGSISAWETVGSTFEPTYELYTSVGNLLQGGSSTTSSVADNATMVTGLYAVPITNVAPTENLYSVFSVATRPAAAYAYIKAVPHESVNGLVSGNILAYSTDGQVARFNGTGTSGATITGSWERLSEPYTGGSAVLDFTQRTGTFIAPEHPEFGTGGIGTIKLFAGSYYGVDGTEATLAVDTQFGVNGAGFSWGPGSDAFLHLVVNASTKEITGISFRQSYTSSSTLVPTPYIYSNVGSNSLTLPTGTWYGDTSAPSWKWSTTIPTNSAMSGGAPNAPANGYLGSITGTDYTTITTANYSLNLIPVNARYIKLRAAFTGTAYAAGDRILVGNYNSVFSQPTTLAIAPPGYLTSDTDWLPRKANGSVDVGAQGQDAFLYIAGYQCPRITLP